MDELDIIREMRMAAGRAPGAFGLHDDVAVLPSGKGRLVAKVDMLVEHTDVPPGMSHRQAARKAVAMCVSDFASKGVRPSYYMVSLGLRQGIPRSEVAAIAAGFADAHREWGVRLVGGDTNEAKELVIDCAMFGFSSRVIPRRGAAPGDRLVVTGRFGHTASGLKILMGGARAKGAFLARAKKSVLEPTPSLREGMALAPYLTSSMDSSDGLARSLHTLAGESGVGFELRRLPWGEGVKEFAETNALDAERLVLEGGEEYRIVGTVAEPDVARAAKALKEAGGELVVIGKATAKNGKVELRVGSREARPIEDRGWTHLRRG